jgi:hypothetical protein
MPSALSLFPSDIPPHIDDRMNLEYLHERAMWLRETLDTYFDDASMHRNANVCPIDPTKFEKIKRYRQRQLMETEERIRALNIPSMYDMLMQIVV